MTEKEKLASDIRDEYDRVVYYKGGQLMSHELKGFRDFLTALFPQEEAPTIGLSVSEHQPIKDRFGG